MKQSLQEIFNSKIANLLLDAMAEGAGFFLRSLN